MNVYVKILLIIAGLAYLINPFDIIPDLFIPLVGWIDDTVILGVIFYLLRYGKLPNMFTNKGKKGKFARAFFRNAQTFSGSSKHSSQKASSGRESGNRANETNRQQSQTNSRPKDPYRILGVDRNATKQEIQAAYREKVKQYHPDRVSSLGEELQEMANKKFVEIKDAYDTLMKRF